MFFTFSINKVTFLCPLSFTHVFLQEVDQTTPKKRAKVDVVGIEWVPAVSRCGSQYFQMKIGKSISGKPISPSDHSILHHNSADSPDTSRQCYPSSHSTFDQDLGVYGASHQSKRKTKVCMWVTSSKDVFS